MTLHRELSGGSLQETGEAHRELSGGSLQELGEVYRELADGTLTKVWGFDHPYDLSASDSSFCDTTGMFQTPEYEVFLAWTDEDDDDKTVDNVSIERRDADAGGSFAEIDTAAYTSDGNPNSYTDDGSHGNGSPQPGDWEYRLRNRYTDGTFSDYSNVASVTTTNPCL